MGRKPKHQQHISIKNIVANAPITPENIEVPSLQSIIDMTELPKMASRKLTIEAPLPMCLLPSHIATLKANEDILRLKRQSEDKHKDATAHFLKVHDLLTK